MLSASLQCIFATCTCMLCLKPEGLEGESHRSTDTHKRGCQQTHQKGDPPSGQTPAKGHFRKSQRTRASKRSCRNICTKYKRLVQHWTAYTAAYAHDMNMNMNMNMNMSMRGKCGVRTGWSRRRGRERGCKCTRRPSRDRKQRGGSIILRCSRTADVRARRQRVHVPS